MAGFAVLVRSPLNLRLFQSQTAVCVPLLCTSGKAVLRGLWKSNSASDYKRA